MKPEDLGALGFPSWLALYRFIKENGKQEQDKIKMIEVVKPRICEAGDPGPLPELLPSVPVVVVVEYVKARAFEELFAALPSRDTLDILVEIATECTFRVNDAKLLTTFLMKQPSRS